MLKIYLAVLALGPASGFLWVYWALPSLGEGIGAGQGVRWLAFQLLISLSFLLLLRFADKKARFLVLAYSVFVLLHGLGLTGWALMSPFTPPSVYVVVAMLLLMAFGLMALSLKDLGIGKSQKIYSLD